MGDEIEAEGAKYRYRSMFLMNQYDNNASDTDSETTLGENQNAEEDDLMSVNLLLSPPESPEPDESLKLSESPKPAGYNQDGEKQTKLSINEPVASGSQLPTTMLSPATQTLNVLS